MDSVLLTQLKSPSSISYSGENSSLTHLLPTWDAEKKPQTQKTHPFSLPFSNLCHRRKIVGKKKDREA